MAVRHYSLLVFFLSLFCFCTEPSWASVLSEVANSMPSGTWAQLNTNGFTPAYLKHPEGNNALSTQFMGEGAWDPVSRQVLFLGAGHFNFSQLHVYSENSNTWTRGTEPEGAPVSLGHGYYHNSISVGDRILGFLKAGPSTLRFYQYNIGQKIWTTKASGSNDGGIAHALVYFPERTKWYVADGTFGKIREYDHISDAWSVHTTEQDCFGGTSYYHQFASYNPVRHEIVFGGGNTSSGSFSTSWCKMGASGTITDMPPSPHTLRVPEAGNPTKGSLITIDPVTGDLLILTQDGKFYSFNFSLNNWTTIDDQSTRPAALRLSSNNVTNGFVVPISTYGVILYADYNGSKSSIWLYKHAQGGSPIPPPNPPDTSAPTTPTAIEASAKSQSTVHLTWQASTDNVGVSGYEVVRNGTPIANPSGTSLDDTGLTPNTTYVYQVRAFDFSGNTSLQSPSVSITTPRGTNPSTPSPPVTTTPNTIQIFNTSGTSQTRRPVSIARPFRKGEIPDFAQAIVDGTPVLTQNDVKNRWADGSLKFAIISFIIPNLPSSIFSAGSVEVEFVNQNSGHNSGFLTQSDLLASEYHFDGTIQMTGSSTKTISARSMLEAGHFRYWLKGPIVTAVIIEDRSPARTYDQDFGDNSKALHPIFEGWFYPQGHKVQLGYTMENIWASSTASNSMRDLNYAITLKSGDSSPATEWTHASFNHIGKTRWHKVFWLGSDPENIRIDHNLDYLISTGAIPHYNTLLNPASGIENGSYSTFNKYKNTIDGSHGGNSKRIGNYSKSMNSGGANEWIGPLNRWEITWLYSMSEQGWEMVTGNADLAGRMPMFLREADVNAGQGDFYDQQWNHRTNLLSQGNKNGTGTVNTFGRPISINARATVDLGFGNGAAGNAQDRINSGPISSDGWGTIKRDHQPDVCSIAYMFSGRYYYLECLQMQAAHNIAWKLAGWNSDFARPGDVGLLHDSQVRGDAWGLKSIANAAFLSPDNEPEQAYFLDKIHDNIASWEGIQNLPMTYLSKPQVWGYGRNKRSTNPEILGGRPPSPLGQWAVRSPAFIQAPLLSEGLRRAGSPWEENFLLIILGWAEQRELCGCNKLLKFMAKKRFRINLSSIADTGTDLGNFIGPYRDPTVLALTNDWPQSMDEFVAQYRTTEAPYTNRRPPPGLTPDHSYEMISLAADSFLTGYTVDGFNGMDAYNANLASMPQINLDGQESSSPKWSITPFSNSNGGGLPEDNIPPNPPRNLNVVQ